MLVNECKAKCVKIFYPEAHNEKTINSVILFSVEKNKNDDVLNVPQYTF